MWIKLETLERNVVFRDEMRQFSIFAPIFGFEKIRLEVFSNIFNFIRTYMVLSTAFKTISIFRVVGKSDMYMLNKSECY
jgi:hypothetical protein